MQSFEMHTEIDIEIYAPYPRGSRTLQGIYQDGELPPYLGKGIIISLEGRPRIFTNPTLGIPAGTPFGPDDQAYTAHLLRIGNQIGIDGVDPCLKQAPRISENLPSLIAGIPDSSSIDFTILNPEFQRFFSSDFICSYSLVQVFRVSQNTRNRVWTGIINRVVFQEIETRISARPNVKRLDGRATFSFEDKILEWDKNNFSIPIICAQLIPYSIRILDHPPQIIPSYDSSTFWRDYRNIINIYNGRTATDREKQDNASSLSEILLQTLSPKYFSFDKKDLVPTNARYVSEFAKITPEGGFSSQRHYVGYNTRENSSDTEGYTIYGSGFWMDIDRGIFILNSEDDTPEISPGKSSLSNDPDIFRGSVVPDGTLRGPRIRDISLLQINDGISDIALPRINRGNSFISDWTVLRLSEDAGTLGNASQANIPKLFFEDEDGDTNRPAHPFDSIYRSNQWLYTYTIIHGAQAFDKIQIIPTRYWVDYWVSKFSNTYLNYNISTLGNLDNGTRTYDVNNLSPFSGLRNRDIRTLLRSKDLYSTEAPFGSLFQQISPGNDLDLFLIKRLNDRINSASASDRPDREEEFLQYTLYGSLNINPQYQGGAEYLKLLPSARRIDEYRSGTEAAQATRLSYLKSERSGGAYYVSVRKLIPFSTSYKDFPHMMLEGSSDGSSESTQFLSDNRIQTAFRGSFNFYYHHDMYQKTNKLLRPSGFIFAVLKNAGLNPSWEQDGSSGVPGDIDDCRMQLIENTDKTYRDLIKRVLPGLGYIVRFDAINDRYDLRNIAGIPDSNRLYGDHMIQISSIQYDVVKQFSSFFFENDDMLRGENTLDEFRDDPLQGGRYVLFNSNPFIAGRNLTIKTGTWTCPFNRIANFLSKRVDRYVFEISNYHLLDDSGNLDSPLIGDWIRLKSIKIPNEEKEIDLLIVSISQSELSTEIQGFSFQ